MMEARPTDVASNATLHPISGLPSRSGKLARVPNLLARGVSMLRTLLIVLFLLLAMIAPVWIPVRAIRLLAARPVGTRLKEDG